MQSGLFIFWNLSFWVFHRTYNQEGKNFSSFREPDGSLTDGEVLWRPSPPQLPYLEQSGGAEVPEQPYLGRKLAAKPTDTTGCIRNPSQWDYHFSLPNYRMDGSGEPYRASDRSWEKPDCQYKVFAAETFSCLVVLPKKGSSGGDSWTGDEIPPVRRSTGAALCIMTGFSHSYMAMDEEASKQEVGSAWRMGDQRDTNWGSSAKQGQVILYKTLNGWLEVRELTAFSAQCVCRWKCRRLWTRCERSTLAASGRAAVCAKNVPGY